MAKNKVEVVIGGNSYSLQGNESKEHMQCVAQIINNKLTEIYSVYNKAYISQSKLNALLSLNLADECVKRQETLESYTISVEKTTIENEMLKEKVKELTLELAHMKEQLAVATHEKKKDHENRGR